MQLSQLSQLVPRKTKKGAPPDLSVGSTFFLSDRENFPFQAKILSREGEMIEIEISTPARPEFCDECGSFCNLSTNAVTGVVVCLATSCGKNFGYTIVETRKINVSDFAVK